MQNVKNCNTLGRKKFCSNSKWHWWLHWWDQDKSLWDGLVQMSKNQIMEIVTSDSLFLLFHFFMAVEWRFFLYLHFLSLNKIVFCWHCGFVSVLLHMYIYYIYVWSNILTNIFVVFLFDTFCVLCNNYKVWIDWKQSQKKPDPPTLSLEFNE